MHRLQKIFFALTKKERTVFIVASAAATLSFIIVAQMVIARATTVVPAAGGQFAEGIVGQPEYVNPVMAASETDLALVKLIYSNVYDVADKMEAAADGRSWTIRLKENLHWQDGEKLTSDDVIFTVQSIQNPDASSPLHQSWQGVAVSRGSELELQFSLAKPYAFFNDNLKSLYILPKHLFAGAPPGNWRLSDYNLKPVGSGPYLFNSYEKQNDGVISAYHLQAWDDYFGPRPFIDHFDFLFFGNTLELVKSFNTGGIDGFGATNASDLAEIARPYDVSAWRAPSYYAVFFNQSKSLPLQERAVRAALSKAVDRATLVQTVLDGYGRPAFGPVPAGAPNFADFSTSSSLEEASATLTAAGWLPGVDGLRSKTIQGTSVPLTVTLTVPQIKFLSRTAELLQNAWRQIGTQVNIVSSSPQELVNGRVKNRDYEALLFGNILGPSSDLYAFWDSSQRFSPGLNLAIYQNKTADSLIENARQDVNGETRTQKIVAAQSAIVSDFPAIFLYSPDYLYVTNKSVRGLAPGFLPNQSELFRGAPAWYLNTARVLK